MNPELAQIIDSIKAVDDALEPQEFPSPSRRLACGFH